MKRDFKRGNISNGNEITLTFRQNRRNIAFCELLGSFRLWKRRALYLSCKMEWKERLNVEISKNRKEITLSFRQKRRRNAFCEQLGLLRRWIEACTTFGVQTGMKRAFKRRNISSGKEIMRTFRQNRRSNAFCEPLGFFRHWRRCALHSACKMEWMERFNTEISQTGTN